MPRFLVARYQTNILAQKENQVILFGKVEALCLNLNASLTAPSHLNACIVGLAAYSTVIQSHSSPWAATMATTGVIIASVGIVGRAFAYSVMHARSANASTVWLLVAKKQPSSSPHSSFAPSS